MSGLNICGILDSIARELRKCLAECSDTLRLHFEPALLGHGGIPNVVSSDESRVHENICRGREPICCGIMGSHIDHRVDIGERNSGKIPKNHHKAPLLVIHIPRLWDTFLSFGTNIITKLQRQTRMYAAVRRTKH